MAIGFIIIGSISNEPRIQ